MQRPHFGEEVGREEEQWTHAGTPGDVTGTVFPHTPARFGDDIGILSSALLTEVRPGHRRQAPVEAA
jgi:hypothetical protein